MSYTIQQRRDTAANWTSANPTLAQGEIGLELDTDFIKIGDGLKSWTELEYWSNGTSNVVYSNSNLPAVPGFGVMWFDPINGWLKFRKRAEDSDANVYVISLSDPIPE